jgi:hypothetical protein
VIPKAIKDAVDERRQRRENCALCERPLDSGPAIFWSGSGDEVRHAHIDCVDWTERPYPGRDLVKRIRGVRRQLRELDAALEVAEDVAIRMERGAHRWPKQAAQSYFRVVDRIRTAIFKATGGW